MQVAKELQGRRNWGRSQGTKVRGRGPRMRQPDGVWLQRSPTSRTKESRGEDPSPPRACS